METCGKNKNQKYFKFVDMYPQVFFFSEKKNMNVTPYMSMWCSSESVLGGYLSVVDKK